MRAVKRWRYYCDYCNIAKGHKSVMEKHERRCTLNPERECGLCILAEGGSPDFKGLMVLAEIAAPTTLEIGSTSHNIMGALDENGAALLEVYREITGNCPACILALIRQHGMKKDDVMFGSFDYRAEAASFLNDINHRE